MQRLNAAHSSYSSSDVIKKDDSSFCVKSVASDNSRGWYEVQLGSSSSFPKCECMDYNRHYLPCKHFFAIFLLIPGYSWNSLPQYFRDSPFINIDTSVFSGECKIASQESTSSTSVCKSAPINTDSVAAGSTDEVAYVQRLLRANLEVLVNFSYSCTSYSSLKEVNHEVEKLINLCKLRLPVSEGLILNPPPVKRRKLCDSSIKSKTSAISSLPVRKRKRKLSLFDKYKNRVGAFADMIKEAAEVSINAAQNVDVYLKRLEYIIKLLT